MIQKTINKSSSQFFENHIIRLPYNLNQAYFYSFTNGIVNYILPIKKEIFNYYSIDELKESIKIINSKTQIQFNLNNQKFKSSSGYISKKYHKKNDILIPEDSTQGIGIGIFPFYRVIDNPELNRYSIMLVDNNEHETELSFYRINDSEIIKLDCIKKTRIPKSDDSAGSIYYEISQNENNIFDFIEVSLDAKYTGIIIPKFKRINYSQCREKFTFSLDIGNYSTHLVYNFFEDIAIKPFDIGVKDIQMVMLNSRGKKESNHKNLEESFNWDFGDFYNMIGIKNRAFVPSIIGEDFNIKFPIRTIICEPINSIEEPCILFGSFNIGFYYQAEERILWHTKYITTLIDKNIFDNATKNRIKFFIIQLFWMIKNKILLNNGRLDKSDIILHCPKQFNSNLKEEYIQIAKSAFDEIFNDFNCKLLIYEPYTASYLSLKNKYAHFSHLDALIIDIGHNNSTIFLFQAKSEKIDYENIMFNGFTLCDMDIFNIRNNKSKLFVDFTNFILLSFDINNKNLNHLKTGVKQLKQNHSAQNYGYDYFIKSGYFSNQYFNKFLIANRHYQFHFILIYSCLIFSITNVIKSLRTSIPNYISFIGGGSRLFNFIFDKDKDFETYTGILMSAFTDCTKPDLFSVKISDEPEIHIAEGGIIFHKTNKNQIKNIQIKDCKFMNEICVSDFRNLFSELIETFLVKFNDKNIKAFLIDLFPDIGTYYNNLIMNKKVKEDVIRDFYSKIIFSDENYKLEYKKMPDLLIEFVCEISQRLIEEQNPY